MAPQPSAARLGERGPRESKTSSGTVPCSLEPDKLTAEQSACDLGDDLDTFAAVGSESFGGIQSVNQLVRWGATASHSPPLSRSGARNNVGAPRPAQPA